MGSHMFHVCSYDTDPWNGYISHIVYHQSQETSKMKTSKNGCVKKHQKNIKKTWKKGVQKGGQKRGQKSSKIRKKNTFFYKLVIFPGRKKKFLMSLGPSCSAYHFWVCRDSSAGAPSDNLKKRFLRLTFSRNGLQSAQSQGGVQSGLLVFPSSAGGS